ncbi:ABC transporter permease [Pseudomonas sp. CCC3.1]|uniref:ABC transporter permease n=1 Tax=Pseudomonas sp. CCC3.1 TaxID=3048607 RepID=UPI002AC8D662|nr:ABC transporter permease [Pseudomonas sp. CCC3.1]MEB0205351.1 ABC transporter permease [Pseudomonas sp. CCC3.1]WPX34688.1 ABC transporter permease [Pseudomonas sp. CCC3.1]
MHSPMTIRAVRLAGILIKEQLKEPIALFWILLSPSAIFYLLAFSKGSTYFQQDYSSAAAWFYAYLSLSIAFFGFSFYIIGRRESGFMRSFIYTLHAKTVFLLAQFLAYSVIALIYCMIFYIMTRPAFGSYSADEALTIFLRFYSCLVLFCIPGLLLTFLPLNFQTANTIFSIASFLMLALGISQTALPGTVGTSISALNILELGKNIMLDEAPSSRLLIISIFIIFGLAMTQARKHLRINPIWSRY